MAESATQITESGISHEREMAESHSRSQHNDQLMEIAEQLRQNADVMDPIDRHREDRANLGKLAGSLAKANLLLGYALAASLTVNVGAVWFAVHPIREYFAADGTRIIPLVPLSEPYVTSADAIQFARDTINRSLTINFQQYHQQLEDVRGAWTRAGFKQFLDQLGAAGYLESVKTKRMNMTVTAGTGVITREYLLNGVYIRDVELPIEIKLAGQTTEMQPQPFIAKVKVSRIDTLDSLDGIALDSVVIKPR